MNFSDSEIIASILSNEDCEITLDYLQADIIFINTCSIREHAEQRVFKRLSELRSLKKKKPALVIGVLGCMAERLKDKLFEKEDMVDIIVGPDAYRLLPQILSDVAMGNKEINTLLSEEETYEGIMPVRYSGNGVSAFVSIMRGCRNFCSYCVVPYTRGTERSRNVDSIIEEFKDLSQKGYREITLLGQNVNSYKWNSLDEVINFSELLDKVAQIDPLIRIRFATSHPKDISDELLHIIAKHKNICKSIHLPVQSGSSSVLKRMNRSYTREMYLKRIEAIKNIIPDCSISTDIITGFCGETEQEHNDTLSIMENVKFDAAYMFKYSEREGTLAAKKYKDDVPESIKKTRLNEIITLQQKNSLEKNKKDIGKTFEVLVEGISKRSNFQVYGRNSQNKVLVFEASKELIGKYSQVRVERCTSATLIGTLIR